MLVGNGVLVLVQDLQQVPVRSVYEIEHLID